MVLSIGGPLFLLLFLTFNQNFLVGWNFTYLLQKKKIMNFWKKLSPLQRTKPQETTAREVPTVSSSWDSLWLEHSVLAVINVTLSPQSMSKTFTGHPWNISWRSRGSRVKKSNFLTKFFKKQNDLTLLSWAPQSSQCTVMVFLSKSFFFLPFQAMF